MNLEIIKQFEGFRGKPYLCPAQIPTIGFGNTTYENGNKVTLKDPAIDIVRAEVLLQSHVQKQIIPQLNKLVKKELNDNQLSAIVSFCYNLGTGNFGSSTLLKKINSNPSDSSIRTEFMKWNKANGRELPGLTKRRQAEADLYFS